MQQKSSLSPQQLLVREAIKQFPNSTVRELSRRTMIPTKTLHRRLIELERAQAISRDVGNGASAYSIASGALAEIATMEWHAVNAMTFESLTHRVRHVGTCWLAERKSVFGIREPVQKLNGDFETQDAAVAACEADARNASRR